MEEENSDHIIEAIGRSRIVIRNSRVVEVGEAQITDCPLAKRFGFPIPAITKDAVKANIEHRIKTFGMCTPDRKVLDSREFVGFGASELLSFGLLSGLIDAAVLVCDGAGTVIVTKPEMAQGIGGRMSGLVKTSPYRSVMDRIEQGGGIVLDRDHARIDQLAGVALAVSEGYRNIAVTVARPETAEIIHRIHPDTLIFAVHVTGLSRDEAES
ncbi:MAG TPA: methanogenesis marker 8 protein, partial [Methanoregula sp.]|nr:methanogenesis marker 8 protein [Methanoregula sp.]